MGKLIIRAPKLISLIVEIFSGLSHYILFFNVICPPIRDSFICNVELLNKISSQFISRFSFHKLLASMSLHVHVELKPLVTANIR